MILQAECNQVLSFHRKKLQMLPNLFRISHTESGMGLTQIYESLIIHENISVRRFTSPIDSIDCIRTLITIIHPLFIAHHFFSRIDKRNTLRSEDYRLRKLIKPDQLLGSNARHTCFQAINKAQTVMAGNVANHLGRLLRPRFLTIINRITPYLRMLNSTHNSEFNTHFCSRNSGEESPFLLFPHRSAKPITQFIREYGNSRHVGNIPFHCQRICRILGSVGCPTFSINTNGRINLVHRFPDLIHGFNIMHSHQVKTETVNMIFFYPIKNGLYHKLAHHRAFTCRLITASGTICQCPVFFLTIKITGNSTFKITFNGIKSMIINHIHYHTDTSSMQCLYHLFELFHTSGRLIRIS